MSGRLSAGARLADGATGGNELRSRHPVQPLSRSLSPRGRLLVPGSRIPMGQ